MVVKACFSENSAARKEYGPLFLCPFAFADVLREQTRTDCKTWRFRRSAPCTSGSGSSPAVQASQRSPDKVRYLSHIWKRQPLGRPTVECVNFNCGLNPRGLP